MRWAQKTIRRTLSMPSRTKSVSDISSSSPSSNKISAARSLIQPGTSIHPLPTPDGFVDSPSEGMRKETAVAVAPGAYSCSSRFIRTKSSDSSYSAILMSSDVDFDSSSVAKLVVGFVVHTKHNLVLISSMSSLVSTSGGIGPIGDIVVEFREEGGLAYAP